MQAVKVWTNLILIWLLLFAFNPPPVVKAQEPNPPKLDIVLIVDESGTMWRETDVDGRRKDALDFLVDMLGASDQAGGDDDFRLSIIAFGTEAETVVEFTPVNFQTADSIKQRYEDFSAELRAENGVDGMGWTDILKALDAASAQLQAGHKSDHKPAIIILTDGIPETEMMNDDVSGFEEALNGYIASVNAKAATLSGGNLNYVGACGAASRVPIYTIPVRQGAQLDERYGGLWRTLARESGATYNPDPNEQFDQLRLGDVYASIYQELVCQPNAPGEIIDVPAEGATRIFRVNSIYDAIKFTILKDSENVTVRIYRPAPNGIERGALIQRGEPGVVATQSRFDEVWNIRRTEPWEGSWTVELSGRGRVLFRATPFFSSLRLQRLSPADFVIACTPIEAAWQVVTDQGEIINQPIVESFQASYQIAGEAAQEILGTETSPNSFAADIPEDVTCRADTIDLIADFVIADTDGDGEPSIFQDKRTVEVDITPRLVVRYPTLAEGEYCDTEGILLATDIKLAANDDSERAARNPPLSVFVRDVNTGGTHFDGLLQYNPNNGLARMETMMPPNTLAPGEYRVEYSLQVDDRPDAQAQSVFRVKKCIVPPDPPTATPTATLTPTATPTAMPTPVPPPLCPPDCPPPPSPPWWLLPLIVGVLVVAGFVLLWQMWRATPNLLPFAITSPDGTQRVGQGLFDRKRATFKLGGYTLEAKGAKTPEGTHATQIRVVDAPQDTDAGLEVVSNKGEKEYLQFKGERALIHPDTDAIVSGNDRFDVQTY